MKKQELKNKLEMLLKHWVEHNHDHGAEYTKWADQARAEGFTAVADRIAAAGSTIQEANARLQEALERLNREREA